MKKGPGHGSPGPLACAGGAACAPDHSYFFFFFFDFLYMPPPGFSFRNMPPPGFSFRWASSRGCVVAVDLNSGVSVTAVELAAWADNDKATRPAAPRSAVRTSFMM